MDPNEVKSRAYEVLYRKYKGILEEVTLTAHREYAYESDDTEERDRDKIVFSSKISQCYEKPEKLVENGFLSKEDFEVVRNLEYIVGERDSPD